MELLEKVLDDKNLFEAYKQVYKNKGASGVDGVTVDELGHYMYKHKEDIKEQIRKRKYWTYVKFLDTFLWTNY